jgi:dimethylaniline monooxygenase (N-oxide forming)
LPPLEQAQQEIAYMNAFSRRRYPTRGTRGDYFFFELIWYTDKLMADVGLASHKGKGRWGWLWDDWVEPCLASDFKGMVDEYERKYETSKMV